METNKTFGTVGLVPRSQGAQQPSQVSEEALFLAVAGDV